MQSVHRQFGRLKKRTVDESQVSVLLKDFEEADVLLAKIIDASKAWRDSWSSILTYQQNLATEFDGMYAPILGAGDSYQGHQPAETPQGILERTARLKEEFQELKREMMEEVRKVDQSLVNPALNAKDSLSLMKKAIKRREDRKLDYERFHGRVEAGQKKTKRSDRDNANLAKAEVDLARARDEYGGADDNLRHTLPRLINAAFSLLPHLLASQILIQNTLLANYYTMLHNYCSEENFPNPAPPMDEVIRRWDDEFKPLQREVETIAILAGGKSVRMPMKLEDSNGSLNGYGRRPSGQSTLARIPSSSPAGTLAPPTPSPDIKPKISRAASPSSSSLMLPTPSTIDHSPSEYYTPAASFAPAAPRADYFSRDRPQISTAPSSTSLAAIAAKKKPPPPPPRVPSAQALFVTALYDFAGQGQGDLAFREGDRIKVTKKSGSTDDWWQGELRGVTGSFPANYCE